MADMNGEQINIAVIGLGRMGRAISYRLHAHGYTVIGYDPSDNARAEVKKEGMHVVSTLHDACKYASIVWMMVPSDVVDQVLNEVKLFVPHNTIIIDGGNSNYSDSVRRAEELFTAGIQFLDCGTSGGIHGKDNGFCLMIGGNKAVYEQLVPLFMAVAAPDGHAYIGKSGAGHYVKMIHNGIEYALMEAYAEGFQLIKEGSFAAHNLNLKEIARVWNTSSVVRSWLLHLLYEILAQDHQFATISGRVPHTGMGLWTVQDAQASNVPVPVIKEALSVRIESQHTGGSYATKIVALLRNKFGGHDVGIVEKE